MMRNFWKDILYALHLQRTHPGFTAAVVLSLGLGIGATTTVFTIINAIFLTPLPVKDIDGLVSIYGRKEGAGRGFAPVSIADYHDFRDQSPVFSGLLAYKLVQLSLGTSEGSDPVRVHFASASYFDVLGVRPYLGRTFLPQEDQTPRTHPVAILGYDLWQQRFGGDKKIIGQTVELNRSKLTVVGIAPKGFKGIAKLDPVEVWIPTMMYPQLSPPDPPFEKRSSILFYMVGRLKPGVTLEQAEQACKAQARQIAQDYPKLKKKWSVVLLPLSRATLNPGREEVLLRTRNLMLWAAAIVLLIACFNVANMLLARSLDRYEEVAIRLSLGAKRSHLIRQFLTESLVLSLSGGLLGLALAYWSTGLLWRIGPPWLTESSIRVGVDRQVLGFTLLLCLLVSGVIGLIPALRGSKLDLASTLRERVGAPTGLGRRLSLRNLYAIGQVALCVLSLVSSSLFLRSLIAAQRIDPGFRHESLLLASVDMGAGGYDPERARAFFLQAGERLRSIPGVEAAAVSEVRLLDAVGLQQTVLAEGAPPREDDELVRTNNVDTRYFATVGIPIVEGRAFNETDRQGAPLVAIVNETLASRYWPGQNALGRRFRFDAGGPVLEVVGIAKDSKYIFVAEEPRPYLYLPLLQQPTLTGTFYVRAEGDPAALAQTVRKELQALDPQTPILETRTATDLVESSVWARRLTTVLMTVFAVLALILSSLGIYGVIAYSVNKRRREWGIRMALGARPLDVSRLIVGEGLVLAVLGVGLGLAGALGASGLLSSLLYKISPTDPFSMASIGLLVTAIALLASYIPARRASRIDPMPSLREE
jgi:macrolide transport system ATP-binding/permease protein